MEYISIIFIVIVLIVGGLLTLSSLIVSIVKWHSKKQRNRWLIVLTISFAITSLTSIYSIVKVVQNAGNIKNMGVSAIFDVLAPALTDNREYLLDSTKMNVQIEVIKSFVPDSIDREVPSTFYTYFGFRDAYRFPLVYPYSINCIDVIKYGQIHDERRVVDIMWENDSVESIQFYGIANFTFDENILLAKQNLFSGDSTPVYGIFHFRSQEIEQFSTEEQLSERAEQLNFSGPPTMISINEYSAKF